MLIDIFKSCIFRNWTH